MKKSIKKSLNFQRTIILTSGVLILSIAAAFVVIAWTGPSAEVPLGNVPALLNTGNTDQIKTGGLTIKELSLDDGTGKGDIINADDIIGGNALSLHSKTSKSEISLDKGGAEGIKFYTGGSERMAVGDDGNLYIPGLTDCFLKVDNIGKISCYAGGTIPGGNLLETTQVQVAYAREDSTSGSSGTWDGGGYYDSYTVVDVEEVVRVYTSLYSHWTYSYAYFDFYINGVKKWDEGCGATKRSYSGSKYYHVTAGDVLKIRVHLTDYGSVGASGTIYTLGAKRELITHAFSDGNILYWYEQGVIGEMHPAGGHYIGANPPTSVIVSAKDSIDVKWILE